MKIAKEPLARKNFRLPQSKIDRAKEILGTETERETVERALDLVAFGNRLRAGLRSARGVEMVDVFRDDEGECGPT